MMQKAGCALLSRPTALVTNIGGDQADQAFHALAPELYKKFAATPSTAGSNR
jgi:hypothetical protein